MTNSTIIPLVAVTAAAAFGLGWVVRPDSALSDQAANSDSSSDRQRVINGSNRGTNGSANESPESRFIARFLTDGEISAEDMKAAIKEMSQTNDPLLRQKMLALLLEKLTPENAKDAFLALRENRRGGPMGRGGDDELRLLANAWGRIDGAGAIAALKEMSEAMGDEGGRGRGGRGGPGGLGREMVAALSGWATTDSAAAIAHLDGLEEGSMEKRFGAAGIIQGMLVNGIDEAMGFVQSLPDTDEDGRAKGFYMSMIASEMIEQDLDTAKSWASSVTDPELRAGAFREITNELMRTDREAAAEYISQYGDDDAAASAVNTLADSWSREDPQAVFNWADEDLSGKAKAEAYEEAMETWAREDPAAAGEYLSTLEPSLERDHAGAAFATRVSREDPVTAMEWANTIGDTDLKLETQIDVARDWYRADQSATNEWIASNNLSEEAVKQITEQGRGGGFDFRGRGGRGGGGGR